MGRGVFWGAGRGARGGYDLGAGPESRTTCSHANKKILGGFGAGLGGCRGGVGLQYDLD